MGRPRIHADNAARQRAYRERHKKPYHPTQAKIAKISGLSVRSVQRIARIERWKEVSSRLEDDYLYKRIVAASRPGAISKSGYGRRVEEYIENVIAQWKILYGVDDG